jgi:DNA-binding SARP family transcriptional activator
MIGATTLLEVSTLGRFEVHRGQEPLVGGNWSRRKVRDLFKLLLSAEQHRLHREQVQEILWPASPLEQAGNSFGKTLYLLRRALEPELAAGKGGASIYVLLDRDTVMLLPEHMRIDADLFEITAKQLQGRLRSRSARQDETLLDECERVLNLYGGDFLPEDLYEDWATRRRDRLRRLYCSLLESAAELALAHTKGQRASEYLLTLLEYNPADEQTHRQLMQTYARMGRRRDAVNQYQRLRDVLREELRTNPLPETTELFRSIQAGRVPVDLMDTRPPGNPLTSGDASDAKRHAHAESDVSIASRQPEDGEQPMARSPDHERPPVAPSLETMPTLNHAAAQSKTEEPATDASQLDPDRILRAALVGREEEIARLQRAYQQACAGQRRVCFISGEPGIGKSRLAQEFTTWGETQQATVLWGYCYEMSGSLPYQPIADAISSHVRACSPQQLRQLLGSSAVDLAKIAPEVRFKLPDLPQPEPLGPEAERRNLYSAVAHYFNALAAERPLILILDDLQWADAATMQLLNFLTLQSTASGPADSPTVGSRQAAPLYIPLYRADEVHESHPLRSLVASLSRGGTGEELRLQRLSEAQVHQLLVNMAGHEVRPVFSAEIYRQTEGNPFFIGEAIRTLILEGKIKRNGDRWQATVDIEELGIPASVRLLIERRLVHLSLACRASMALAAVLGRQFSSALLSEASKLTEDLLAAQIDEAIQAQVLTPLGGSLTAGPLDSGREDAENALKRQEDSDLAFTHDKIREVLYQSLNPLRRRALHRQAALAIEARYADVLHLYYSTLAYHYQMAEDGPQAVSYLLKATEVATSVYAFLNAASYLKTVLDLLTGEEERPRRAELLQRLSGILLYTGRLDEAINAGQAAALLWRDLGDSIRQAEVYLDLSFLGHWQGRELESVRYIKEALACLERAPGKTLLLAKAYVQWGLAATVMGEPVLAREKLRQADELHGQSGESDPFILVVSLWSLSWCAYLTETPEQMLSYARQGAEVCRSSHKPDWEPMMNYSAAWACMLLGRLAEGEQLAQEALQKAQQHGVVGAQGWANLVLAFLAIQRGNWEEARICGERANAIATMLHDADLQARVLWGRSVCAGWENDWPRAVTDILQALEVAKKEGETSMVYPHLLAQAAKAHLYIDKLDEAQHYLNQARELSLSRQYRQLPALIQRLQGRLWQARGWFDEAEVCFERALNALQTLGDPIEYARTQEAYGLLYLMRNHAGDAARARQLLESARQTFRRLGVNG